jgi:hypothetical protein
VGGFDNAVEIPDKEGLSLPEMYYSLNSPGSGKSHKDYVLRMDRFPAMLTGTTHSGNLPSPKKICSG